MRETGEERRNEPQFSGCFLQPAISSWLGANWDANEKEPSLNPLACVRITRGGLRDYQKQAILHGLNNRRTLLLSPTASGKSLIIYMLAMNYPMKKLIVVPTTGLVHQLASDFSEYGYEFEVHKITAGASKEINTNITITTWQSIYKLPREWFKQFKVVIGDEAHNFKAKSLTSILTKCTEARYRFGLTGTLDGTQTHKLVLEGLFGPHKNITTSKELIDRGDLANLSIDVILLKHKEEDCKEVSKMKYQDEIDWIVRNNARNKFIRSLALDQKGNTLILFQFVEKHGVLQHMHLIRPRSRTKSIAPSGAAHTFVYSTSLYLRTWLHMEPSPQI